MFAWKSLIICLNFFHLKLFVPISNQLNFLFFFFFKKKGKMTKSSKSLKLYLDEVCDMLDTYGGRDKVRFKKKIIFETKK